MTIKSYIILNTKGLPTLSYFAPECVLFPSVPSVSDPKETRPSDHYRFCKDCGEWLAPDSYCQECYW